ncbi:MAG: thioredoxin family protein, partial [Armatimonadota bacterium]
GVSKSTLTYHDKIEPAQEEAKSAGQLVFVNFTGVTCTNCRVMEDNVLPDPAVSGELKDFARAELYTDRSIPADRANAQLREQLTQSVTNPVYVVMTADRKVLGVQQGASSVEEFVKFLKEAKVKNK